MLRTILIATLFASPAFAQDGLRSEDQILDSTAMADLLTGRTVEFYDGSKSNYGADGSYGYTYTDEGPVWSGTFQVFDESRVCVDFDNGSQRCDLFVMSGEKVVLITDDGLRFPVRNLTVYQQ